MIRYSLICAAEHGFEAWFRDSGAFDDLSRDRNLSCPRCGSADVRKALMAPAIGRRAKSTDPIEAPAPAEPTPPMPVALNEKASVADEASRALRDLVRDMHAKVKAGAQNVGAAFPEEARRIHEGEDPPRSIYGTASPEQVRSLIEDGVAILPLPPLPDERN